MPTPRPDGESVPRREMARALEPRALPSALVLLLALTLLPDASHAQSTMLTPLATIQGAAPASTFDEQAITTWGVVTAVTPTGFYLQDPQGDGNPATSDGLFAFTYDAPTVTVGECVQVAGEVVEYYAKTELNWIGEITPSTACGSADVTPAILPLLRPGDDPVAVLEAYEGMVVRLGAMTGSVHGPTKLFSSGEQEIAFLSLQWQRYLGPRHLFHDEIAEPALHFLSNGAGATLPVVHWGDQLHISAEGLVGILDYNFGKYQLLPLPGQEQRLTVTPRDAVVPDLPPARADEYGVCSYNLHGLGQGSAQFPNEADYATALRERAAFIATHLLGCTVLALQETGNPADAHALAAELSAAHGLAYRALAIAGPASEEAEFPLTNSILIDATRVTTEVVGAVTGCSPVDYGIFAPGVCPAGEYPVFDRPPLMAKLRINGPPNELWASPQSVWVINNHWKSKSGDESANARLRAAQANAVAERVQAILAVEPDAQLVVLGDLNDFYGGAAVRALQESTGLFHPYSWLPASERYTYIFNGAAQVLDHALVSPNLMTQLALVEILHLQADRAAGDAPLAHSDHDPVVLRVRPGGVAAIGGTAQWAQIGLKVFDDSTLLGETTTRARGEFRVWGLAVGTVTLEFAPPAWIVVDDPALTVEVASGMTTPTVPPIRHMTATTGAWLALQTPWLIEALMP